MHLDFEKTHFSTYATDICIIGGGVAAITMARRLLAGGRTVTILESGGVDWEPATAALNAGSNVGESYYELDHARLRFFGGTTAIWGGRVAQLDAIDLEKRDWVPHSGWPITMEQLQPYYDEAAAVFGLPVKRPSPEALQQAGVAMPAFDPGEIAIKLWSFDPNSSRFTLKACADLVAHPRCTIFTHATVTAIDVDDAGHSATSVQARSPGGRRAVIRARTFVLAAGGIENPRLLLASRSVQPAGLGNGRDLVGRFFMEHPHARGGKVVSPQAWSLLRLFGNRHTIRRQRVAALVSPGERAQERERMLNTALTIASRQPADAAQFMGMRAYNRVKHDLNPSRSARMLWLQAKKAAMLIQKVTDPARPWLLQKLGCNEMALVIRAEQAPNPDSRVMLSGERDALGMPRVQLDWRINELDIHSVDRLVHVLGREMARLDAGRLIPADWLSAPDRRWCTDPLVSAHPIGGYHHMGTTRMSDTPATGVVDANGRVHGMDNLYIAGSSVFPTSGWANPTYTIVALALRTGDCILRRAGNEVLMMRQHTTVGQRKKLVGDWPRPG
ncbi:GMC family oxidoreductase [Sphingobium sp. 10 DY56-G10]|uniref:FAD-dependent oxidoreductase n=1 Tax=Sphingomonadales TaxID=204457 RepID=UPI0000D7BE98|nr:GMC family oxidoreductase [Sphingomonas sp. SKA58]EAT10350.1 possible oxidoreductase [Sphingomonas sp. SKA58]